MSRARWFNTPRLYPLRSGERELLIDHVEKRNFFVKYQVYSLLYTGLRPGEAAHLTADMIAQTENGITIHLPSTKVECVSGGQRRRGGSATSDGEPCRVDSCDGTYRFDNIRSIPIRAKNVVSTISYWFDTYESGISKNTYHKRTQQLRDEIECPRLTPTVLRLGFGVLLAEHGFERDQIATVLGYDEDSSSFDRRVVMFGELTAGDNPFKCNASTKSDDSCSKGVKKNGGRCRWHRE